MRAVDNLHDIFNKVSHSPTSNSGRTAVPDPPEQEANIVAYRQRLRPVDPLWARAPADFGLRGRSERRVHADPAARGLRHQAARVLTAARPVAVLVERLELDDGGAVVVAGPK